ncbi:aminotransferase class V-fold PLP-dependent enzyme [bacterium]|nr:aminotransferase class V-fold PLP-dependent enzyme [bacterium]
MSKEFNISELRKQFPYLTKAYDGKGIRYFDSGATTQKPASVIEKEAQIYSSLNANVHRGVYKLAQGATKAYEDSRARLLKFIGADSAQGHLIFTRGTTEAINLVAHSWGRDNVRIGELIVVSRMDHHSNFVPWQYLAREKGAKFRIAELHPDGRLDMEALKALIVEEKPKVFAFPWVSNVTGVINPVEEITAFCREHGVVTVVDAAQAVGHFKLNLSKNKNLDFVAFSSHKMYGPTGVGALWGRTELLEAMKPYQLGGEMISEVRDLLSSWNDLPWKFEAGTPNFPAAIAWAEAADFLDAYSMKSLERHMSALGEHFLARLAEVEGVALLGPFSSEERIQNYSLVFEDVHVNDLATFLDQDNICIRVGHHCAEPLHRMMGETGSCRVSLGIYNNLEEVDFFFDRLADALEFFRKRKTRSSKKKSETKKNIQDISKEVLMEWLRDVEDPELKMSLVDLGLIYDIKFQAEDSVVVDMTLTSPGCPVAGVLVAQVKDRVASHPGVKQAEVKLVWEPKWNPKEMASEEAKEVLGIW